MPNSTQNLRPNEIVAYETSRRRIYQVPSEAIEQRFTGRDHLHTVIYSPYGKNWEPVTGPSKEQEEAKWNAIELVASFPQAKDNLEHYEYSRHVSHSRPWTEADQTACFKAARAWSKNLLSTKECTYGLSMELYLNGIREQGRDGMEMMEVESNDFYRREFLQEPGAFTKAELQDMCDLLQGNTTQFALYRKERNGEETYLTTTSSLPKHRIKNGEAKQEIEKDTGITPDRIVLKRGEVREKIRMPEPYRKDTPSNDQERGQDDDITKWRIDMIRHARAGQQGPNRPKRHGKGR